MDDVRVEVIEAKPAPQRRYFVIPLDIERAREWLTVLGSHCLPVTERAPIRATTGPFEGKQFYRLAVVERMGVDEKMRVLAHVAPKFSLTIAEAAEDFEKYGVPLLAEGLVLVECPVPGEPHMLNPGQFSATTTVEDIEGWLAADVDRMARLEPAAYKGDALATAEYEMVRATVDQLRAELRYIEEAKHRKPHQAGAGN